MIKKFFDWIENSLLNLIDDEHYVSDGYLSEYFSEREMTKSHTAERHGFNNQPNAEQLQNLRYLCLKVLDKVREKFGAFTVSSGFRSKALNFFIGGSKNSQHMKGQAADFEIFGVDNLKVYNWIKDNLVYDQLILEHYEEGVPNSGWIHVSYSLNKNRKKAFKVEKGK